jgi:hypothetical protein
MFRPNRPSADVQVAVMKDLAAHCNTILFLLCGCLGLIIDNSKQSGISLQAKSLSVLNSELCDYGKAEKV